MGKRIRAQRRGRGGIFEANTHKSKAPNIMPTFNVEKEGTVLDIIHNPGRGTPLAKLKLTDGQLLNIAAPEGLFLGQTVPHQITINNKEYIFVLRRQRTYLPFSIELIDFKKVMHSGTGIAKSYSSDINLIEGDISKHILIKMNAPLRHRGYTFYQSSFIESPKGETTVLAAVKNYGRLFPYISSIIMCCGLLIHLFVKLPKLFNHRKA